VIGNNSSPAYPQVNVLYPSGTMTVHLARMETLGCYNTLSPTALFSNIDTPVFEVNSTESCCKIILFNGSSGENELSESCGCKTKKRSLKQQTNQEKDV